MAFDTTWLKVPGEQLFLTKTKGEELEQSIIQLQTTYATIIQLNTALDAAKLGVFKDGGAVATKADLSSITNVDNFTVYHITDTNTNVYASNGSGSLVWIDFAPDVDLSAYTTTVDMNNAIVSNLQSTKDYINEQIAKIDTGVMKEVDPTVPNWAKQTTKPNYTAGEVGAVPITRKINGHTLDKDLTLSDIVPSTGITKDSLSPDIQATLNNAANTAQQVANMGNEGSWGEIDTGKTFRGKKIYRQDFTLYVQADANSNSDLTLVAVDNYVSDIISVGGYWDIGYGTERWNIPSNTDGSNYAYVLLFGSGNRLTFRSKANNKRNGATAIIIVEYTKK